MTERRREVFYVLYACHRKKGIRSPKGTYPRYVEARSDGLVFHNKGGWHFFIERVSIPYHPKAA